MPAANIEINGTTGSKDNLPINTIVQLSNADIGGEVSYLWEILDQPEGAADVLSSGAIENPTFTPQKEGTYLLRLTVNDGLGSEVQDLDVCCVRHMKSNERIPAAMETIELDTSKGWKTAVNRLLVRVDRVVADANLVVCVNPAASFPAVGNIVRFTETVVLKSGLPGQERLLRSEKALATTESHMRGPLGVVVGVPDGGIPAASSLVIVRRWGLVEASEAGSPAVGDYIYVSDTGTPALAAGTETRIIGRVVESSGGFYWWMIDGSLAGTWIGAL